MELKPVTTLYDLELFQNVSTELYRNNIFYRRNNEDLVNLFISRKTIFRKHSKIKPFLIINNEEVAGRFIFIQDFLNPNILLLSFFEAKAELKNLSSEIVKEAKSIFPDSKKLVIGIDGHLNNGAGILLNRFDELPAYGLPYTLPYYPKYFNNFEQHCLLTFSFPLVSTGPLFDKLLARNTDFKVRPIDKICLREEIMLYTELNNACFTEQQYWVQRDYQEDFEIFYPFRHLMENENLLFIEYNGKAIGFLLWFPDYNQMIKPDKLLNIATKDSADVLRFKHYNSIKRIRLAEIAILPPFQNKGADLQLLKYMLDYALLKGYKECEGGFISETNTKSINLTLRYIERITKQKVEPYRKYGIFEKMIG